MAFYADNYRRRISEAELNKWKMAAPDRVIDP